MNRTLLRAAVIVLGARLVWMHVIPAWNGITTDFQNYYTASWAVTHHHPLIDLYDTSWFQRESELAGFQNQTALFNYFTPFSALVMWPISNLPALGAKRVWVALNLVCLAITVVLVAKLLNAPRTLVVLVALLGGDALGNNFTFGQFYIVLTLLLVCVVIWIDRRPALAGWCLSFVTIVKVFPAVFIVYAAYLRRWRVVVWALGGIVALSVIGVAAMGWIPHRTFIDEVLPRIVRGEIQDPYNVRWNTLQALLRRALVAEPGLNPQPMANVPLLYFFIRTFVTITIFLVTFVSLRGRKLGLVEYGAIIAAISLITPSQASYHQVLFFPAIASAIHSHSDTRVRMLLALVFALICSNYMGAMTRWDSGAVMLLAFPRVYLVLALWLAWIKERMAEVRLGAVRILVASTLIACISAGLEWQRWNADETDGATMARPEQQGLLEIFPTVSSAAGLVFAELRPEGYTLNHPSAFDTGFVYESHGAISGKLPDGTGIRWPGAIEPSLGPTSVVAVSENYHALLERTRNDPEWRELVRRDTLIHDPAISPDGGRVAFSEWVNGRYRISEWTRATGSFRTLLEGPADYRYPSYPRQGAELAFATNEKGNWDIGGYTYADGTREILTSSLANDYMPAYSPDGSRIYFASDRRRGYRFTAIYALEMRLRRR